MKFTSIFLVCFVAYIAAQAPATVYVDPREHPIQELATDGINL